MDEATSRSHVAGAEGHEHRDVSFRPLVLASLGFLVVLPLILAAMWGLYGILAGREARLSPAPNPLARDYGRQVPPEPRLQAAPMQDLMQLRAREDRALSSYGWVDREKGMVRIPIERAMDLLEKRGLPTRARRDAGDER